MSHGELKRLSLYMWLKFNKIENSIVLMDEVEIGLHPDWQYEIVNDLQHGHPAINTSLQPILMRFVKLWLQLM